MSSLRAVNCAQGARSGCSNKKREIKTMGKMATIHDDFSLEEILKLHQIMKGKGE
jgi:hypothetical protein